MILWRVGDGELEDEELEGDGVSEEEEEEEESSADSWEDCADAEYEDIDDRRLPETAVFDV